MKQLTLISVVFVAAFASVAGNAMAQPSASVALLRPIAEPNVESSSVHKVHKRSYRHCHGSGKNRKCHGPRRYRGSHSG